MEKKKLILVAVSVGVFLVIAISASILFFAPKPSSGGLRTAGINPATVTSAPRPIPAGIGARGTDGGESQPPESAAPVRTQPASADVVDMVRNADGLPGLQSPPVSAAGQEISEGGISIVVRPRTAAGVPGISTAPPAAPLNRPAPEAKPVMAAAKPPVARTAAAPAKPAAAPAKPAVPSSARQNNDYWVQIGAFSAKVRAEGVKETLASKGITTIIDDRDVDGKILYRVRVGPYTSESEAGYWLALVKEIDGFTESQIRTTKRQ
ncbi:hypothetical protein FACS1894140_2870 [Spirochaetia bacterium]|nr:hypothetical protein FACS1894140_2870 [Spirochaetia bacterium]